MTSDKIRSSGLVALALAGVLAAGGADAATFGELAAGRGGGAAYPASPYGPGPYGPNAYGQGSYGPADRDCPPCGPTAPPATPQGAMPAPLDMPAAAQVPPGGWTPPQAYLPFNHQNNLPAGRLQVWSFGQVNSTTDPFNSAGLSTPFMFVPWSTPLSAWTNAQAWNWWRERAGVQPPYW